MATVQGEIFVAKTPKTAAAGAIVNAEVKNIPASKLPMAFVFSLRKFLKASL